MAGTGSSERATIGPSIVINGDISGEEDLLVQGRIEGTVNLQQHRVAIGPDGKVKANVCGRLVTIEGEVEGDLRGGEQVILHPSARVRGNIVAPRVILEDGARFQGSIDMDVDRGEGKGGKDPGAAATPSTAPSARPKPLTEKPPASPGSGANKPDPAG